MDDSYSNDPTGDAAGELPGFFGTEQARPTERIEPETWTDIDDYLERHPGGQERLIPLLHRVQEAQGFVPFAVQEYVADRLGLSPIQVHGVVSFYNFFSTTPRGEAGPETTRVQDRAPQLRALAPSDLAAIRERLRARIDARREQIRRRDASFFTGQKRIALRNCGVIDPLEIDEYIAADGYLALERALFELSPPELLRILNRSGLRGRAGAGFAAGLKWQLVREARGEEKYVVCNADDGDPGAFTDRGLLEGDPHSVIEAMTIAGWVVGSRQGYIYVRAEYPLAIERLDRALYQARERGLLGKGILGSGHSFDIEIRIGPGAYVCGEETALINSIEGRRGTPRPRPPFPAQEGLWGKPTLLNNVETWVNVPPIIHRGAEWFTSIGMEGNRGTKVIALAGCTRNTGLVEVPMGTSLRQVVEGIGGGTRSGRPFKAVQCGGPSGGCIPAAVADVPIDYEALREAGAMMGSGGLVVMDESVCIVELARSFLGFLADESCGKCPPCRIGTRVMLKILDRITEGDGRAGDLDILESLGKHLQRTSLCGLGQSAPNTVLSSLRYFRDEYVAHVVDHRCPAGRCSSAIQATRPGGRKPGVTRR